MPAYTTEFYEGQMDGSARSALAVVPVVFGMLRPGSVCDVGCGVGAWLGAFAEHGVTDFVGLDGDYVDRALLKIPPDRFSPTDLEKPIRLARRFDLAMSLEVAEHLSPSRAEGFVEDLTRLAPVVLFSAAVPKQGGVNHVNEQWPSWWARIFAGFGFKACDAVRSKIWGNDEIDPWYRQNILVYATDDALRRHPSLSAAPPGPGIDVVHPAVYSRMVPPKDKTMLAKHLWWAVNNDFRGWRAGR